MNMLSKRLFYSGILLSGLMFSNCDNPKYPDPVPHPEADPKKSTQVEKEIVFSNDCTLTSGTQANTELTGIETGKNAQ